MEQASFLSSTLVLIPALNEAECIPQTVNSWLKLGVRYVRVVDNGSTDQTRSVAAAAGAQVLHESRRGYGAACWTGLQSLPPDVSWILFSSADGSDHLAEHDLPHWQSFIHAGADLLIGNRCAEKCSLRNLKLVQRWGNALCSTLIWAGWGRRFEDLGSLRMISRQALSKLRLQDRGFGWNVEMQVRAVEEALRIVEVPVQYHPRRAGKSKISGSVTGTIKAALGMTMIILRLWRASLRQPAPAPDSAPGHYAPDPDLKVN